MDPKEDEEDAPNTQTNIPPIIRVSRIDHVVRTLPLQGLAIGFDVHAQKSCIFHRVAAKPQDSEGLPRMPSNTQDICPTRYQFQGTFPVDDTPEFYDDVFLGGYH